MIEKLTAAQVANALVSPHAHALGPVRVAKLSEDIAAAIREAEDCGRTAQIVLDLPSALESENRGNVLEEMLDRMFSANVDQGLRVLGSAPNTKLAPYPGHILDDAGMLIDIRDTATLRIWLEKNGVKL